MKLTTINRSALDNLLMFSGQGSHYYGMGDELFKYDVVFKRSMLELDEVAFGLLGVSVVELLYQKGHKKSDLFDDTRLTSAAIFMVEHSLTNSLRENGLRAEYVLGVSLGIYAALCAADCLDPNETLSTVIRQAELIEHFCPKGAMVAVLADPETYYANAALNQNADLAGISSNSHFVISTIEENLFFILDFLQKKNLLHQNLAVSRAFHSRWVDPAQDYCLDLFNTLTFRPPKFPIICCMQQGLAKVFTAEVLWRIVREPIRLLETLEWLIEQNAFRYIDAGPSGTLSTLLKYRLPPNSSSEICSVLGPFPGEYKKYLHLLTQAV